MPPFTFKNRAEKDVKMPIPGTKLQINAILRGDWSQSVVVLLHGLPGNSDNLLPYLHAKSLAEKGFATLRVNLYDEEDGTRDMVDCLLQTHADDLDTIVRFARKQGAPQVMAAGHSYGGLIILRSTQQLDAAVLWDPSHFRCSREFDETREKTRHIVLEKQDAVVYLSGAGRVEAWPMVAERRRYENLPEKDLARKDYPLLFIAAGDGQLKPYIKKYYAAAHAPKKLVIVKNATHCLTDTDKVFLKVLNETTEWFRAQQLRT